MNIITQDNRYNHKESNYYGHYRPEILSLVKSKVNRVLDVGCSDGSFASQLLVNNLCNEAHGIEPFEDAYLLAQEKLNLVFHNKVEMQIDKLEDNYYDIIFFNDVLEHLIDPELVLNKFRSKLTKNGVVITSVPNVRYLPNLFNLIVKGDWKYEESGVLDNTHLRFFTFKSFARMVTNSGYDIKYIAGNDFSRLRFKGIKKIIGYLFRVILNDTEYLQILSVLKVK